MKRIMGIALLLGASVLVSNAIYGQRGHDGLRSHRDFQVVIDRDGLDLELDALQDVLADLEIEMGDLAIELGDLGDLEDLESLRDLDANLAEQIEARVEEQIRRVERRTERVSRRHEAAEASQNAGPQDTETFRWSGAVAAGQTVEIKGVNGPVYAEAWDGAEVVVEAIKSGRKNDPGTVRIEVVEHSDGVTLCAVYPGRGNSCARGSDGESNVKNNDVRVEFRVQVPAGVDFVGRTVNGGVEALGIDGDVEAFTVNGDIDLDATGSAEARTVNGDIRAAMGDIEGSDDLKFFTVNGGITLELPADVNADLDAKWLSGSIESDLPIEVEGKFWQRSAHGRFGDGGPDLEIATVNGSIRLLTRG